MYIEVSKTTRINFDGANYMPEYFRKGGETVTVAGRESVTEDKWIPYKKYYSTPAMAISFLVRQSAAESNESISLAEYVERIESTTNKILAAFPESVKIS